MKTHLELKTGIELPAMVDIVFLLVTYFLINATLIKNPNIKIKLPKSMTATSEVKKSIVIQINKDDKVFVNDLPVTLKQLPVELAKLAKNKKENQVIIRGDKKSSYQRLITVIDYVNQTGINHFNLATERMPN